MTAYKKYVNQLAIVIGAGIFLTALMNASVDPANIYHFTWKAESSFVDTLVKTHYGLFSPKDTYNERAIKKYLAKKVSIDDCVVIGSSHIMQIGSNRPRPSLSDICPKLINLGVSGAGLEDQLALARIAIKQSPRKLILEVAPWTFAFGKDIRWTDQYPEEYQGMLRSLGSFEAEDVDSLAKLKNLFSHEYTIRSLKKITSESQHKSYEKIAIAPELSEDSGGDHPVIYPDGSLLYSQEYIENNKVARVIGGGDTYKTDGKINDPKAIQLYSDFLAWLKNHDHEVLLIMTPYHPKVFEETGSLNYKAIKSTDNIAREIALALGLQVIGSFDPAITKCAEHEFYDFMHPKVSCLERLDLE